MEWNAAHLHLLLNHVPILATAFALLLLGWGRWRGRREMARAALVLFFVGGVVSVAVFLSGDPAEDALEGVLGVSEEAVDVHEEAAELAMVVSVVVGVLSGALLFGYRHGSLPSWVVPAAAVVGLVAFVLLAYTGLLGGRISHPEVRPVVPTPTSFAPSPGP